MKINVDAAISKNSSKASASAVVRDSSGMFVGASVVVTEGISDPEIMEAVACRESLALASDLMLQKFRVACDNITVVRNIRGKGFGPYGHVIQEIKARGASFTLVEFVHEGRMSNGDAHRLVRGSLYEAVGRHVWFISPPEDMCTLYSPTS
jgi:ribonuclease HI